MKNRYKIIWVNTQYLIYDIEFERFLESTFAFTKDAKRVCAELNKKNRLNRKGEK